MVKNLLVFFLISSGFLNAQESYNSLVYEGNSAFGKKNYERSSSKFMEAAKIKDKDFAAHYNLGNSFYKRKMYEEARAEYQKAETNATTLQDKMAAQYNIGNTFMETQQPEKAAEYYKNALKQDPYNESAQRNYQIAKLKEKEKKEQQNQKNKSGGNGKNQNKNQNNEDGKGDTPQQKSGGNNQNRIGNGENGNQPNKKTNEKNIPEDLEKAILERSENKERETARRILNKNANSMPQSNEKDW
ncbi:tetratricopeptide repeat protein [Halpernia sp.]|uniref:tetratricopeptide repeat protein n=1 Tax=Halpernia sp. TaxID=2782209 RepID=UPI003A937AF1